MRKILISKVILVKKIFFNLKKNNRIIILLLFIDYIDILLNISYIIMLLSNNKMLKIIFTFFSVNFFKKKKINYLYNITNWNILELLNIKYIYVDEIKLISGNNYDISIFPVSMFLKSFSVYELLYNTVGGGVVLGIIPRKFFNNKIFQKTSINYKNQLFFQIIFSLIKYCQSLILFKNFYFFKDENNFYKSYQLPFTLNNIIFSIDFFFKKFKIVGKIFKKCKSFDQVKTIIILIDNSIRRRNCFLFINSIKGRGKSALLGFFIGIGIYFGLKYILVSSKMNSNFFVISHFLFFALKLIGFKENRDFIVTFQKLLYNSNFNFIFNNISVKKIEFRRRSKSLRSKNIDLIIIDDEKLDFILENISCIKDNKIFLSFSFNTFNFYEYLFSYKIHLFLNRKFVDIIFINKSNKNKNKFKRVVLKIPISLKISFNSYNKDDKIEKWLIKYIFFNYHIYYDGIIKIFKNIFKLSIFFIRKTFMLNFFSKINIFLRNLGSLFYNNQIRNNKIIIFEMLKKNTFFYLLSTSKNFFSRDISSFITGFLFLYNSEKLSKIFKKNTFIYNYDIFYTLLMKIIEIKNIVIHPKLQNLGYGSKLLSIYDNLKYSYINRVSYGYFKADFLHTFVSVSFFLKLKYYCFWFKNGFKPVNLLILSVKNHEIIKITMLKIKNYNKSIIKKIINDYFLDFDDRLLFLVVMGIYYLSPMNFITIKLSIINLYKTFYSIKTNKINNFSIQLFNFLDLIKIFSFFKGNIQLCLIRELFMKLSFFFFNSVNFYIMSFSELLIVYLFGIQKKTLIYIKEYLKISYYRCYNLIKKAYLKIVFRLIENFLFTY
uniref:TcmA/NAT10 helicase domain-containing protein n=1 Tax=Lotharella vacuolata TaxID=74820 RepID=A0A0H5BL09_9EUKA|nr:hypothetical protein [Lotharella vacuolata]